MKQNTARLETPIGPLTLVANETHLTAIRFGADSDGAPDGSHDGSPGAAAAHDVLTQATAELNEYFAGTRTTFDVPLDPGGTPFQQSVWRALRDIPYGRTVTYGELARRLDRPDAPRAVGAANGRNPIPVIIPCHRVVGHDGALTGFAGGLEAKATLLRHEAR